MRKAFRRRVPAHTLGHASGGGRATAGSRERPAVRTSNRAGRGHPPQARRPQPRLGDRAVSVARSRRCRPTKITRTTCDHPHPLLLAYGRGRLSDSAQAGPGVTVRSPGKRQKPRSREASTAPWERARAASQASGTRFPRRPSSCSSSEPNVCRVACVAVTSTAAGATRTASRRRAVAAGVADPLKTSSRIPRPRAPRRARPSRRGSPGRAPTRSRRRAG